MKRDWGWLAHGLAGFVTSAFVTALGVTLIGGEIGILFGMLWTFFLLVMGWAREVGQHDETLTWHQKLEAYAWPIGGAIGFAGVMLISALR